jgi:hypothetical protein
MKNYLAIIKYKDGNQQSVALSDTFDKAYEWVHNTLEIDNIEFIVLQQMAIIETLKFEKNEENTENH